MPTILDLYCKEGGAGMGYWQAGFDVVGIDIEDQPNYPFDFIQGDVTRLRASWVRRNFDAVHASPPCQASTRMRARHSHVEYPELIPATRDLLEQIGLPSVIENVEGAALIDPITLCGSSFGLRVRRHRLFETSFSIPPVACDHSWQDDLPVYEVYVGKSRTNGRGYKITGTVPCYGGTQIRGGGGRFYAAVAMGIDWMSWQGLTQAIPPAYTRYIGLHLITKEIKN